MADKTDSDSRNIQISRDGLGSDSSIPLSPQWLLPKPGENKPAAVSGDIHTSPLPTYANRSDAVKTPGNGDETHDNQKKRDVFRPSMLDSRDRWRDEERETNSSVRKDRWREGDKELGDSRKVDRWADNSSGRHYGETRRAAASDRWNDSGNRDANHDQRRESKWNTRWGRDDKESDIMREKWVDSGKDNDAPLDKGLSHSPYHGKEEREGDHHRPWRSSSALNRGRVEPPHHQSPNPNKQIPVFVHGRGRGETTNSTFSAGRGRVASGGSPMGSASHLQSFGSFSEKGDGGQGETSPVRYSRIKLLDLYRSTDMRSSGNLLDGLVHVPSLTQDEALEPFALVAPTSEELVILKGIDKGDILSSGVPQFAKDGSALPNSVDLPSRRPKLGSREDLPLADDNYKDDTADSFKGGYSDYSESLSHEKRMRSYGTNIKTDVTDDRQSFSDYKSNSENLGEDGAPYMRNDDVGISRESRMHGNSSGHSGPTWRSLSMSERMHSASHDLREVPTDTRTRTSEFGWSQPQKDLTNEWDNSLAKPSYSKDGPKWKVREDPVFKRQASSVIDREQETRMLPQPLPEDLFLRYKDPKGEIQGPFPGIDIISWFDADFFGLDLEVQLASAPIDSPFQLLGDVMPHLRAKARPPPGFSAPKSNEASEGSSNPNFSNFSKVHLGSSENNLMKNDPRYQQNSTTEAENRFLESLMSSNMNGVGISEGIQGYFGNNPSSISALGAESGDKLFQLAKRMNLERQKSVSNPYSHWPGRDSASIGLKADILQDTALPSPNILAAVADNIRQQPQSQNADFMSILQGLSDRPASGVNSGVNNWSNFSIQGGLDPLHDKLHGKNIPIQTSFGIPPRVQASNMPSLTNLRTQGFDSSSGALTPEKLLAFGLSQDPQILTLLQQQYMSQLQPQAPIPTQQLSILDEYMLLKQQQLKQEQQQQQLLRQQLLSQVLTGQHSLQRFNDQSFGQLQTSGLSAGHVSIDHRGVQQSQVFQMGPKHQVPTMQDIGSTNFLNMPSIVSQGDNCSNISETSSVHLPHQMFGNTLQQKDWSAPPLPEHMDDVHQNDSLVTSSPLSTSHLSEACVNYSQESTLPFNLETNEPENVAASEAVVNYVPADHVEKVVAVPLAKMGEDGAPMDEELDNVNVLPAAMVEGPQFQIQQSNDEKSVVREAKAVETREVKKTSEKKSKKQKSSKGQSSDVTKASSRSQQIKHSEAEGTSVNEAANDALAPHGEVVVGAYPRELKESKGIITSEIVDPDQVNTSWPANTSADIGQSSERKSEVGQAASVSQPNTQVHAGQRAWKPAPGFKPKSLLEIQQEEKRRAQAEMEVSDISNSLSTINISTPWAGIVGNSDHKFAETKQEAVISDFNVGAEQSSQKQKTKKSHLHDLLAGEVVSKSNEKEVVIAESVPNLPPLVATSSQSDSIENDNFIDAKEAKKSRKKSAKAKGNAAKVAVPTAVAEVSFSSSPKEKVKSSRQAQQEKEVLPPVPSSPSLGDFVVWKGETANPSPAPAWSIDSGKLASRTSLRDILKEQEKKGSSVRPQGPAPIPQKTPLPQSGRGNSPSWSASASSPAKAASPIQIISTGSAQSKQKLDDDLFWGPIDHPKQETKQSDFPQLASQGSFGKNTSVKGVPGGSLNRQKSMGGRSADISLSSSPSLKGKRDVLTKHSEAIDFREWCESECFRLIGTKDTSFLEFCLKQSRSEAEILLTENLGSYDPDHEFIDKFLNYKDFLPAEVLEIAFQGRNDRKVSGFGAGDVNSFNDGNRGTEQDSNTMAADGPTKGGGKKKGKKGKKVSPAVLGFNVVSNRIMMGEIQTVED